MSLALIIYLIGIVDVTKLVFGFIGGMLIIFLFAAMMIMFPINIKITKTIKFSFIGACFLYIVSALIPSSGTIAAMYLVPKLAQNKALQHIPGDAAKLLDSKLKEWAKDVR